MDKLLGQNYPAFQPTFSIFSVAMSNVQWQYSMEKVKSLTVWLSGRGSVKLILK